MVAESAYIDTSVLGAYYCPESLSVVAENTLRQTKTPVISNLSEIEFCSLISRKLRLKEIGAAQAKAILALFASHVAEGFYRRMSLSNEHFIKARQLLGSLDSSLRTLDALHLAAAMAETITIMTADRYLAKAAKRHKVGAVLVS
jgi:uncharacterized protein